MRLYGDKLGWEYMFFFLFLCFSLTVSLGGGKWQELGDILKLLQSVILIFRSFHENVNVISRKRRRKKAL